MRPSRRDFAAFCLALGAAFACPSVWAEPEAEYLLTLRNPKIAAPHGEIRFTRERLEALPWEVIRTSNDYIDGPQDFRGPRARQVIDMIGHAGATHVRVTSLNDYSIEIELAEIEQFGAILAMELDGEALTRRDKGPIWLMYPIDSYPELQDSVYNNRLVWQLKEMELF